jgi:hypothetical protein
MMMTIVDELKNKNQHNHSPVVVVVVVVVVVNITVVVVSCRWKELHRRDGDHQCEGDGTKMAKGK